MCDFDYFGHGASSGDFRDGTVGRWAEDAIAVIDELTEGPQILIGSSLGGWLMLLAALARPQRIHALVGIASAPDATEDLLWPRLDEAKRSELVATGSVTLASEYDPAGYTSTLGMIEDGRRHLVMRGPIALDCPVRLLHGIRDAFGTVADERPAGRTADESRCRRHPRQGRRPPPIERSGPRPTCLHPRRTCSAAKRGIRGARQSERSNRNRVRRLARA